MCQPCDHYCVIVGSVRSTANPPASEPAKTEAKKSGPSKKAASKQAAPESKAAKKDPVVAQKEIDAGSTSLQAGKFDLAVQQFSSALTGGSLPAALMARAHYQRGLAYRKQSKPALAISDLTHALWIKNGLNEADRADALQNRIAAYRDAGLPDQADSESIKLSAVTRTASSESPSKAASSEAASATNTVSAPLRTGSIPADKPAASLAPTSDATTAPSTGLGTFFGSLFGGSSSTPEQPSAATPPAKSEVANSAWSAGTAVKAPAAKTTAATRTAALSDPASAPLPWQQTARQEPSPQPSVKVAGIASAPAGAAPRATTRYILQVALLKTAAEAQATAEKIKKQLGPELGGRQASIVTVSAGGFGTLHRVGFEPFNDAAEWKSICASLLKSGYDCQPLAQ